MPPRVLIVVACISVVGVAVGEPSPRPAPAPAGGMVNPNTTAAPVTTPQSSTSAMVFDAKKLSAIARPAVAFVEVFDKDGKLIKTGTGFFVSPDGKFVTNAHVIEGGAKATAKLENGATY